MLDRPDLPGCSRPGSASSGAVMRYRNAAMTFIKADRNVRDALLKDRLKVSAAYTQWRRADRGSWGGLMVAARLPRANDGMASGGRSAGRRDAARRWPGGGMGAAFVQLCRSPAPARGERACRPLYVWAFIWMTLGESRQSADRGIMLKKKKQYGGRLMQLECC